MAINPFGGARMSRQSERHKEICEKVVEVLEGMGYSKNDIYLSHEKGEVMLYRFYEEHRVKGNATAVKSPDIAALRNDTILFAEVELDSRPAVIAGDLKCIDISNRVCLASDSEPMEVKNCLALVVIDDPKEGASKEMQLQLLRKAIEFSGSVAHGDICTCSTVSDSLEKLLRGASRSSGGIL